MQQPLCPRCRNPIQPGWVSCPQCGQQIQWDGQPAPMQQVAMPPPVETRKKKRPIWQWAALGLLSLCVLGVIGSALTSGTRPASPTVSSGSAAQPVATSAAAIANTAVPVAIAATATKPAPAATATIAAPSATATAVPMPKVGEMVKAPNWEMTVTKVERKKQINRSFGALAAKGEFVIIEFTVKNIGAQNFGLNGSTDFYLYGTADGKEARYSYDISGTSGYGTEAKISTSLSQVPPGLETKSAIVFDINPAATSLFLEFVQAKKRIVLE